VDKEQRHDLARVIAALEEYIGGKGNPVRSFDLILEMRRKYGVYTR